MNHARKNMGSGDNERRFAGLAFLVVLVGIPACASLLGIEDIQQGPSASAGSGNSANGSGNSTSGSGNSTSDGGKSNPGGGANQGGGANPGGGASQTAGDAGEGPSGGASPGGTSGAGGASGGSTAGSSGAAGAGGAGSSVHGHVIDFWGHKLSAVPVQIGASQAMTDTDGGFTIASAPAQYDVSLVVSFTEFGRLKTRGWVYQGLTRRDPTLQVYEGLPSVEAPVDINPNNPAVLTDPRTLTVALGGTDVSQTEYDVSGAGTDGTDVIWQGPTTTKVTAHALIWENGSDGFPGTFLAYDTQTLSLSSLLTTHTKASFNLAATGTGIPIATITGTVAGTSFTDRSNEVFLRFPSNAVMLLLTDTPTTGSFTYTVPSIATVSATVAASQGDVSTQYAIAHKDGLAPGATLVNFAIPAPAKSLAVNPTGDLNKVSATTQFAFTAGGTTAPFVAVLTGSDPSVSDDRLYVVSSKAPFTLPEVAGGMYTLKAGGSYVFRVETHGALADVDAMAGPTGFLDAFSISDSADTPSGPRTGDGSYTLSAALNVKAAP